MLPLPRGAVWQALFIHCALLFINGVYSEGRVVCYYTNWSVYRPGTAKFNPQNINPYLCTHLVYAFGGFTKDNQMKPFDKYQDIEQGGFAKFTGLKTYNKQLKTMIAIGGWNEASSRFSPLMANPERRHQFIKNILKFLRQNRFDGIDLDWEYPAHREGGKSRDRDNYAQFVQELRAEFEREAEKTGRPRLLITMAVPAGIEYIEKGYDIPKLNKYLDWFNVLTYDFHSSHEPSVNHHAPLYSLEEESEYNYDTELNIDYAIKFYLKAGADRDKLVLGIPTYGRSYTLINEESTELGAPSDGPGEQGDATREKGYLAYYEICQNIKDDPEWTIVQPNPNAMGPYAYRRNQWVGYDDENIVRKKAKYVVEHGLGGIMFWAIDNDDFRGTCTGKPYPLIEAAKEAMLEGLGLGINEVAKPNSPKKPLRSRSRENSASTRNRIGGNTAEKSVDQHKETSRGSIGRKRIQSSTTAVPSTTFKLTDPEGSSLYIGGRTTTPAPPTTPDPGADFKCEEEGFFQHPRDCKKYFWCLDSGPSGLGIVAHQFTCPSGLYFNPAADSCDFTRNVPCKTKKSTTAAPITSSTTTSTSTSRPTSRVTAATARTTFFRTTTSTTTTTTTPAPLEEYEDDDDEAPKDKESEEDPKVIKELIELIRKVGGIEELEKHLLRKDDGTFSIKENDATPSGASTTVPPISKKLYDKVLSRPNTYNSFRNRFASTLRSSGQSKTVEPVSTQNSDEEEQAVDRSSTGSSSQSKYSSVVRGNSRQGPQNEGIDTLSEFDGLLKERKQYVTINRNRSNNKQQSNEEEAEEGEDVHKIDEYDNVEEGEVKSTRRPTQTAIPSYSSIKRTRPTTLKTVDQDELSEKIVEEEKAAKEKKSYSSLNRKRGRYTTTTENPTINEATSSTNRYKFLERKRPTKTVRRSEDTKQEESNVDDDADDDADEVEDEQEDQNENVKFRYKSTLDATKITQEQQQSQTTTRVYASIGRRRPSTTTTETPDIESTTTTIETPNQNPINLENNLINKAPVSISTTTITTTTTTNTPTSTIMSVPITTPTTSTLIPITTNSPLSNEIESNLTIVKDDSSEKDNFSLSLNVNSLFQESLPSTTTESDLGAIKQLQSDNNKEEDLDSLIATTTIKTVTTTATTTTDGEHQTEDEVTKTNETKTKNTQYQSLTRTRTLTKTTINETVKNETNKNQNAITTDNTTSLKDGINTENNTTKDSPLPKYAGGRRQQLFTRRNQISKKNEQSSVVSDKISSTTETVPTNNNEISGTVSSPRPFGFPRRRSRPTLTRTSTVATATSTTPNPETNQEPKVKTKLFNKFRTPTVGLDPTTLTRRPVLKLRRRIGNTPATSQSVTTTAPVSDLTTTELTATSKYSRNRNRQTLSATVTPTLVPNSSSSSAPSRNYFNNKSKTKFTASATLLTTTSPSITTITNDETPTSISDITQRLQNTKYPTSPALRRKFQTRRLPTTTTASANSETVTDAPRTQNPLFKRRLSVATTNAAPPATITSATVTAADTLTTTTYLDGLESEDNVDQVAKSSIHTSRFNQITHDENLEDDDEINVVKAIKKPAPPESLPHQAEVITRRMGTAAVQFTRPTIAITTPAAEAISAPTRKPVVVKRRPHKSTPVPATQSRTSNPSKEHRRRPHNYAEPFERLNSNQQRPVKKFTTSTYRSVNDYDYYDDDDVGVVGNTQRQQLKVILHGGGIIECLDQGNFPHPLSCRKFISCAKFETGGVVGWEYTCPKGLSYDPVGGMCNWAAGLGCKE